MIIVAIVTLALLLVTPVVHRGVVSRRAMLDRAAAQVRGLPAAVVLLQIEVASGQSPRTAITAIARHRCVPGDLGVVAAEFSEVARRLQMGADLSEAILSVDPTNAANPMIRVLDTLRRAEHDGVALLVQLELLVTDLRRLRALGLDREAQRLTISLLVPLVFCILPAFILLAIVPLLLSAAQGLPG